MMADDLYPVQLGGFEDDLAPSWADIKTASQELDGRVRAFSTELAEALPGVSNDAGFLVAWNKFISEWNDYRDSGFGNSQGWQFDRRGRRDGVMGFRKRFNDLQAWFAALPGAPTSSTPSYKGNEVATPSPWPGLVQTAVTVGIVGLGVYVAAQVGLFSSIGKRVFR